MYNGWSNDLSTKIEWINDQHKELFERIELLSMAFDEGKGKEEIINTLKFLQDYIMIHFRDEENLQTKYNYPDYLTHKKLHADFIKDFNEFKHRVLYHGASNNLVCEVKLKLTDWLINHIALVDKEMTEYLIKNNDLNQ